MLSRTSFDTYTKASVEIQLFLTLATLGIYTYGIRSISKIRQDKEKTKTLFTELFLIGLIFNVIFALFYLLYIRYINNHTGEAIYFILMVQFIGSSLYVEWMNEALEDYRFITIKSILVKILYISSIFIFVRSDNLISYGFIVSLAFVLESLLSFLYITFKNGVNFKKLNLKKHIKPLFLIFLITNISLLYVQTDKMMLGLLLSDSAVTTYTIPNYIVTAIYNVVLSILIVGIPRLNDLLNNKSEKDYVRLYNELIRAFSMIFIPILFFVFVTSEEIIVLYAAGKYNDSITPLKVFSVTIFINALLYIQREGVVYLYEKEKRIILYNLIGGVFNISSNFILYFTGLFTPINAIFTLFISYFIVSGLMRRYIHKEINKDIEFISRRVFYYFLFSIPIVIVDYFVSLLISSTFIRLITTSVVSAVIYVGLLYITKDQVFINNVKVTIKKIRAFKKQV